VGDPDHPPRLTGAASGVNAGQAGGAQNLPAGVPLDIAHRLQDIATQVFTHAYVQAMKPTMAVPAAVMLLGAISCLAVKGLRGASANPLGLPLSDDAAETADAANATILS
jgi:hypothetical protein